MFSFDVLKSYGSWTLISTERINEAQLSRIKSAEVVLSHFEDHDKIDIKITMNDGSFKFIGIARNSNLSIGDNVDMSKGVINTLRKDNKVIYNFLED